MAYARIKNGAIAAYPYPFTQLRRDNPHTSFPKAPSDDLLAAWGVYPVTDTPRPEFDPMTQDIAEGDPVLEGETWVRVWTVTDVTPEERARRLADKRATMRLMRGEFAIRAAGMGLITPEEAEAWAGGTSLPASVTNAFAAHIADDMERLAARVDALTASHIHRVNPLILLLQAQLGLSDDSIDALFSGVLGPNT